MKFPFSIFIISILIITYSICFFLFIKNYQLSTENDSLINSHQNQNQNQNQTYQNVKCQNEHQKHNQSFLFHLVFTRFALNQGEYTDFTFGRYELFRTFFLPSFIHQQCPEYPTYLLIGVGTNIHPILLEMMQRDIAPYNNIFLMKTDRFGNALNESSTPFRLKSILKKNRYSYYINTRFDSDDVLGPDLLHSIQNYTLHQIESRKVRKIPQKRFIIDFPQGWKWNPSKYRSGVISPISFQSSSNGQSLVLPHPYHLFRLFSVGSHHKAQEFIERNIRKIIPEMRICPQSRCWVTAERYRPMWIYVRSSTSDSRKSMRVFSHHLNETRSKSILRDFNLNIDHVARSIELEKEMVPRILKKNVKGFKN